MQRAMDGFKTLFGETLPPLRWLRHRGLQLTNQSEWVKQVIMRQAMGLNGDLPPLARYG
jgi:2-octaprenylphenol hydroxylase